MYNNNFGYGVYKKSQVNVGSPYEIKQPSRERVIMEEDTAAADELEDAQKKAQRMIEKAREEAQLIKKEAEFEAERIIEEAKSQVQSMMTEVEQQAKEEGYRYGETVAQQHYNDLLAEAEDFRNRSESEYEQTIMSLEQDIVDLALNIAKKVIAAELEVSSDVVVKLARETINACVNRDQCTLKVSSQDYDYVVEHQESIKSAVSDLGQLEIKKDTSLKPGACLVDSGFGLIDGGLDTKMEAIQNAFYAVVGDQKTDE